MKLLYDPATDSLYIEPRPEPSTEAREISPGVHVDLDERGELGGFDIDQASRHVDLTTLETAVLPLRPTKAA